MRVRLGPWVALLGMTAPLYAQEIVQITNGHGKDSRVEELGGPRIPFVAIESTGDLTPSVAGNADGSK